MKNNIFKHSILAMTATLGLVSCEDRELITIGNDSAPIVMDLSTQNLILNSNAPANPALTIRWENAAYTVPVETKYEVQISATESFEVSHNLTSTAQSQNYASFTTQEMNEGVKVINFVPYVSQKLFLRIASFVGSGDMRQYSNVTSMMITPYLASPTYTYSDLYLVGNAAIGNWDNLITNNAMIPLLKTSTASVYTHTGLFKSGTDLGFKIVKVKGSWDDQFGLGAAAGQLSSDGGSGNLTVPAEGYYKLTVDTSALTYSLVPVPAPTTTYNSIAVNGTSTGNADLVLTKSTFDPHIWVATNKVLKGGNFKFKSENLVWGSNSEFFGTATVNGPEIPLTSEWNYDIYFNDATGDYSVIPVKP